MTLLSMECPNCQRRLKASAFNPQPWCGSPEVLHDLCAQCQGECRYQANIDLAARFEILVRMGQLAA